MTTLQTLKAIANIMILAVCISASSPVIASANPLIHITQALHSEDKSKELTNIVFIPGLMSNASVWDTTAKHLTSRGNYDFHFIELAGFAGNSVNASLNLDNVTQAIVSYIKQNQLDNTVIIGHSMGAFLAYNTALQAPEWVSKVIAVDGLPFITPIFTRTNSTTAEQAQPFAQNLKSQYAQFNPAQLAEITRQGVMIQARDKKDQEKVISMAAKSDPITVGNVMAELMTTDLREDLKTISTPILLLGASGGFSSDAQHSFVEQLYREQFDGVKNAKVTMNTQSRHFVMYDDLPWLVAQINDFLTQSAEQ